VGFAKNFVRRVRRPMGTLIGKFVLGMSAIARRIPGRAALRMADFGGFLLYLVNGRGRRAGHENLKAVYGDTITARERRRILRGSYRTILRAGWALLHLQPLPPARYARWVSVAPELDAWFRYISAEVKTGVIVSGHFGNWELLLAARCGLPYCPKIASMVEQSPVPELDRALDSLRARSGASSALRKGGALALKGALDRKECVGLLIDRNVRREHGGVYVPFLGLPARTTPLPAILARRYNLPLSLMLCLPYGKDRWQLWMSPNLMEPPTDDEDADVRRLLGKVNDTLSDVIRRHPESWLWMIKRWKSRPTLERGRYPAYSYYDPDPAP
jgi:KDO2-lipid IV(A) lauroyltransferase